MKPTIFPNTEKIDFSKQLNIKFGIDPTSDKLHLGHLVPLLFVKKLWHEGHNIDIVIGTFTAQLGDPSGKDAMRPILSNEDTQNNAKSIMLQIHRFFGEYTEKPGGHVSVSKNHVWFEEMGSMGILKLLSNFTTTQLLARDSFQKRIENNNPIGMHELAVPVLQGFDSVHLKTDVEIGGSDQMFNFGITRDMQRIHGQEPEKCILMPIINGTDGRKMSKSFGNCIFFNDTPNDVFGKVMSISDDMMKEWWSIFLGDNLLMGIDKHPMEMKKELAFHITDIIWQSKKSEIANGAQMHFENTIQNNKLPDEIPSIISTHALNAVVVIRKCSVSEAKRLIKQGAVRVNDVKIDSEKMEVKKGDIIKVGKLDLAKVE